MESSTDGKQHERQPREITLSVRLRRPSLRTLGLALLILVLLFGGVLGWRVEHANQAADLFSPDLKHKTNFPLLYPTQLSGGLRADKQSVLYGEDVVTFSIYDAEKRAIAVSEQGITKQFNFADFVKHNIELPVQLTIPQGKLLTGKLNGLPVCMLVTDKTWAIVNDPTETHGDKLESICRNLQISK